MKKTPFVIFPIFFLFFVFIFDAYTDSVYNDENTSKNKDSIHFKYKFNPGDTLVYNVVSYDSIVINFDAPLMKKRYEIIEVICDSVSKKGTFYLRHKLIDFQGFESKNEEKNTERSFTPWLNRSIQLEIDSVGRRYSYKVLDTVGAGMSPGGAYQPYLFFPFDETSKVIGESWIVQSLDDLPENGIPIALLRYSSLFRAFPQIDTLGELCNRLEYIKTGQGNIVVNSEDGIVKVASVINSFGILDISVEKMIPIHYYCSIEQKLTITVDEDEKYPGSHFITSFFTLADFKKAPIIIKPIPTKKKINKK